MKKRNLVLGGIDLRILVGVLALGFGASAYGQGAGYWQQHAAYTMIARLDVKTHRLHGWQRVIYTNHSPDTLDKVYYHMYFNAFQPGSMMDVRSRVIEDPDARIGERIYGLEAASQGYQKALRLTQDGRALSPNLEGTVLAAPLAHPLLPGAQTTFEMRFEAQVPEQIRRTGRDNAEGIAYSMAQWYPKLCEYDAEGWHADDYVGREFYGVWGDFEVFIAIDTAYVVAATGVSKPLPKAPKPTRKSRLLQKPTPSPLPNGWSVASYERVWRFEAKRVHDFVWAADPDYVHDKVAVSQGRALHFYYQKDVAQTWKALQPLMQRAFAYVERTFGDYPYPQYAFIQGGDGGMEYPMATLINGKRALKPLASVAVHELLHAWFQGLLASHEGRHAWFDEGFTVYAEEKTWRHLFPNETAKTPFLGPQYARYRQMAKSGREESLHTWSDHFQTNRAYAHAAYVKGAIFQHQLAYIVGEETLARALRRYAQQWRYKHPTPKDYLKIVSKIADMDLKGYYSYFVESTKHVDYGMEALMDIPNKKQTHLTIQRIGAMPMPVEVLVTLKNNTKTLYYIPLRMMRGIKKEKEYPYQRHTLTAWPWTHPFYTFALPVPLAQIKRIEIDPSGRLTDVDLSNQTYPRNSGTTFQGASIRVD